MATGDDSWRTPTFRQSVVAKIDEAIQRSGMPTSKKGIEMESQVFQRAKTKDEYLSFVARLILHVREMNSKKGGAMGGTPNQNMQDPIGALQNLARTGTGNQMMVPPPMPQQTSNPNLMQALNPRPMMQQKLPPQPGPQGGMMGLGGMVGSPLSNQMGQLGPAPPPQQRKANEGMMLGGGQAGFMGGPRGVAPPGQYLRQSPTPPNVSPAPSNQPPTSAGVVGGLRSPYSNQMVSSPALVPSPNPQLNPNMRLGMAASPGSSCLNTPGGVGAGAGAGASPCGLPQEDAYREKIRQLSKYIEPLRKMMNRIGNEDTEKVNKMRNLLDILVNPTRRLPLETLLKCEVALEKMDLKRGEVVVREQHPLLEALRSNLQSPVINHTLQRTFGPCMDALFGSDIKVPTVCRRKKMEESPDDIPEVLQGEIARLDQRFKVSLDPSQTGVGSRSVQLVCWLDDRHLPCVPPVSLTVPEDYPASPPRCHLGTHEHSATAFLVQVQAALESRVARLPAKYTVSQLLDTWEMSVRQACTPNTTLAQSICTTDLTT